MSDSPALLVFIERLTLRTWLWHVWPRFLWQRLVRRQPVTRCFLFESSRLARRAARATAWLTGTAVEPLVYDIQEVRDDAGLSIRLRLAYQDLAEVQADVMQEPLFAAAAATAPPASRMVAVLAKRLATTSTVDRQTLWRAMLLVQVCAWKTRTVGWPCGQVLLMLERRPWLEALQRYARRAGVPCCTITQTMNWQVMTDRFLGSGMADTARRLTRRLWRASSRSMADPAAAGPMAVVEYYGQFNLNRPELFSDLFFWQQSSFPARQLLLFFKIASSPLDREKWTELVRHGISAVALHPQARAIPEAPLFIPDPGARLHERISSVPQDGSLEARWLHRELRDHHRLRAYWTELFARYRAKLYLSWHKYDATHCAIADAMEDVGGVTAIYQRAYEALPTVDTTVTADVVFGFSPQVAEIERRSRSQIAYHVATGYPGDHRFLPLRQQAAGIRAALQRQGARQIIAFFDENTLDDPRWEFGHAWMQEHYAFLLEKVLSEPWLGLILKPKRPHRLRRRLGPVAALLARAQATGRCHLFEEGIIQGSYPPAAAALASDLTIGALFSVTAGLESALSGVPTLLIDREGWRVSPLYRLGPGRVVFTEWPALWEACLAQWKTPGGVPGLGDWSPLLPELDPFRD